MEHKLIKNQKQNYNWLFILSFRSNENNDNTIKMQIYFFL